MANPRRCPTTSCCLAEAHCVAGSSALIGASNLFELALAAAISLLGFNSGAAPATVVVVLVQGPVMLSVVAIVNRSKGWENAAPRREDADQRPSSHLVPPSRRRVLGVAFFTGFQPPKIAGHPCPARETQGNRRFP